MLDELVTASAPATISVVTEGFSKDVAQGHGIAMSNFLTQDLGLQDNEKGQVKGHLMARGESLAFSRENISDRPYFSLCRDEQERSPKTLGVG